MTPDSHLVKVGSWSDLNRLQISHQTLTPNQYFPPTRTIENRTYILTSVLEPPFLMLRRQVPGQQQSLYGNARFDGYSKDLADMISRELNINFEIRPVKDGQYGVSDSSVPGGWTGMIGELVRNEADLAISPLTINAQREQVVDFSVPFMSAGISIMIRKSNVKNKDLVSFMEPLSKGTKL